MTSPENATPAASIHLAVNHTSGGWEAYVGEPDPQTTAFVRYDYLSVRETFNLLGLRVPVGKAATFCIAGDISRALSATRRALESFGSNTGTFKIHAAHLLECYMYAQSFKSTAGATPAEHKAIRKLHEDMPQVIKAFKNIYGKETTAVILSTGLNAHNKLESKLDKLRKKIRTPF